MRRKPYPLQSIITLRHCEEAKTREALQVLFAELRHAKMRLDHIQHEILENERLQKYHFENRVLIQHHRFASDLQHASSDVIKLAQQKQQLKKKRYQATQHCQHLKDEIRQMQSTLKHKFRLRKAFEDHRARFEKDQKKARIDREEAEIQE